MKITRDQVEEIAGLVAIFGLTFLLVYLIALAVVVIHIWRTGI